MKLLHLFVYVLFIVLFTSCSSSFCRKDSPGCEGRIVGTYQGEAQISTKKRQVLTSFFYDDNGRLRGRYFSNYHEYFKNPFDYYIKGELFDIRPTSEYMLRSLWVDGSGYGNLRMVFSFDGQEFTGYRGFRQDDANTSWYGKKVSDKPILSIEDLREFAGLGYVEGSQAWWPVTP